MAQSVLPLVPHWINGAEHPGSRPASMLPAPIPIAVGINPAMIERVVINIGRSLT